MLQSMTSDRKSKSVKISEIIFSIFFKELLRSSYESLNLDWFVTNKWFRNVISN